MGTTTYLELPYPEGTDLVIGGDDAIQALAEKVEERLYPDASVTVGVNDSSKAVGGATAVDFSGPASMGGFTVNAGNEVFTYTGDDSRFFMVCASVEIDNGAGGGTTSIESTVYLQHNGANVLTSLDFVQATAATLTRRRFVHNLTLPMQMSPGETVGVTAYASPAGSVGVTSLRIYPVGSKL